jgi:hypothetical protein
MTFEPAFEDDTKIFKGADGLLTKDATARLGEGLEPEIPRVSCTELIRFATRSRNVELMPEGTPLSTSQ